MILGVGNDLIDIRRIEKALKKKNFAQRVFTNAERIKGKSRKKAGKKTVAATYAKRYAAKEAAAKALGFGMREGIGWQDIEVVSAKNSAPSINLKGAALRHLKAMTPRGRKVSVHLALTDEYPYAHAIVIISAS